MRRWRRLALADLRSMAKNQHERKKRRDKTKDGTRYSSGVYLLPDIIG
jgi:hypothetical protein